MSVIWIPLSCSLQLFIMYKNITYYQIMLLNQSKKPMTLSCGCFFRSLRSKSLRFDHENISFHSSVYSTLLFGVIVITVVSCSNSTLLAPFLFLIYTAAHDDEGEFGGNNLFDVCTRYLKPSPPHQLVWMSGVESVQTAKQSFRYAAMSRLSSLRAARYVRLCWPIRPVRQAKNKNTTDTHIG